MSEELYGIRYDKNYQIIINNMPGAIYYYFDYDERSYHVNMDFQHFHSFYELHILLSPEATHQIEGIPYLIHANDFVLLRPSLLHKTTYLPGAPSKRVIINFLYPPEYLKVHTAFDTLLTPFFEELPIFRFDHSKQQILNQILNEIFSMSRQSLPSDVKMMMIHNHFQDFLYQLWELREYNIYTPEKFDDSISEKVYQIISYIHNHYQEPLSLESLAKQVYLSSCYLSHQFKRVTGYTLIHYIQMTRIRGAQYALINTSEKITDISEKCGFTSFSQFNRIFRRFCGASPSEFRREPAPSTFLRHTASE